MYPTFDMSGWTGMPKSPLAQRRCSTDCTPTACGVNRKFPINGWDMVDETGYVAIPQATMSRLAFSALGGLLDEFAHAVWTADAREQLDEDAREWNAHKANAHSVSGAPVGLVDRRPREDKSQKVYLQICAEFGFFLRGKADSAYYASPTLRALVDASIELAGMSEVVFREAISWMPMDAREKLSATGIMTKRLPIMVKFLSYFPDPGWATPLHYDKSALTQVLYANDAHDETFVIGPNKGSKPDISELQMPERFAVDPMEDGTALLFPGMLMKQIGITSIAPSPHGVMPVKTTGIRHSAIAFLLVPRLEMSGLQTTLTDL